jgi:sugar phosphate isomerase/epimerase
MKRREFLMSSAIAAGSVRASWGQGSDKAKLSRIAIMTGNFSSILKSASHPNDPKRTLDIMDVPDMFAERFGVHYIEPAYTAFHSTEPEYFREFKERLRKAKSQLNQISLGALSEGSNGGTYGPINISSVEPLRRIEAIDLTKRWIDRAADLGCPRLMVNEGALAPEVRKETIAALKTMVDYGKTKKVFVTMETRGDRWQDVVEVLKGAGGAANPDTGNFFNEEERHAGLRVMYPMSSGSSHVHYAPDKWSLHDALQIAKEVGYKGLFSVESGANNGPDPESRVQTVIDAILKEI